MKLQFNKATDGRVLIQIQHQDNSSDTTATFNPSGIIAALIAILGPDNWLKDLTTAHAQLADVLHLVNNSLLISIY